MWQHAYSRFATLLLLFVPSVFCNMGRRASEDHDIGSIRASDHSKGRDRMRQLHAQASLSMAHASFLESCHISTSEQGKSFRQTSTSTFCDHVLLTCPAGYALARIARQKH